jgi:hypothetical protein
MFKFKTDEFPSFAGGSGYTNVGKDFRDDLIRDMKIEPDDRLIVDLKGVNGKILKSKIIDPVHDENESVRKLHVYMYNNKFLSGLKTISVKKEKVPTVDYFFEEKITRPLSGFTTVELLTELVLRESQ